MTTPNEIANQILESVGKAEALDEGSKEMQDANVSSTRKDADDMDSSEIADQGGEENAGTDSKSKQGSSTSKYKSTMKEMEDKEVGSDVEDKEDQSDNTVANTDAEHTSDADHNETKRDKPLTGKTGMVSEDDDMGDEEEPEGGEESEDVIKDKIKEYLESEAGLEAMKEHIEAMFKVEGDDQISEEFQKKATTVFEAALAERVAAITDIVVEEHKKIVTSIQEKMEAAHDAEIEKLVEHVDDYLTHATETWMQENQIAIDNALRVEIAESFISDFQNLLEDHNITVSDEQFNALDEALEEIESLKDKLNETKENEVNLSKELRESKRERIFNEATADMTLVDRERFASLTNHLIFENEESYRDELKIISESYINKTETNEENTETAVELNESGELPIEGEKKAPNKIESLAESMGHFSSTKK